MPLVVLPVVKTHYPDKKPFQVPEAYLPTDEAASSGEPQSGPSREPQ